MKVKWTPERIRLFGQHEAGLLDRDDLEEAYAQHFMEGHLDDDEEMDDLLAQEIEVYGEEEMRKRLKLD